MMSLHSSAIGSNYGGNDNQRCDSDDSIEDQIEQLVLSKEILQKMDIDVEHMKAKAADQYGLNKN